MYIKSKANITCLDLNLSASHGKPNNYRSAKSPMAKEDIRLIRLQEGLLYYIK